MPVRPDDSTTEKRKANAEILGLADGSLIVLFRVGHIMWGRINGHL